MPPGPVSVELDRVTFAYPAADKVSLASLEEVATLDTRGGERRAARRLAHGRSRVRSWLWSARRAAASRRSPRSIPRLYDVDAGSVRVGGVDVRELTFDDLRATIGVVTQDGHLFHDSVRENLRYADPSADRRRPVGRAAQGPPRRPDRLAARRPRHGRRRARLPLLRRRAPAADDRPAAARQAKGRDPRRGDGQPRLDVGGGGAGRAGGGVGRPDGARDRPPPVDDPRRRPGPRARRTAGSSNAARTPSCSPPTAATPSSTKPSSTTRPPTPSWRSTEPRRRSALRCPVHARTYSHGLATPPALSLGLTGALMRG